MRRKRLSFEKFKEVYSLVPRLTVEVIAKTSKGIILTKRSIEPYKGMWHIPGGTVLFGETLEEAVARVAKEELELMVKIKKLLGYIHYPNEAKERGYGWTIGLAFLIDGFDGEVKGSDQGREFGFFKKIPPNTIKEQKEFLESSLP